MSVGKCRSLAGLIGLVAIAAACEPGSILEAREQLGRGGERTIVYALPIIDTVFKVETLLEDSEIDTIAGGLLAVEIEEQTVPVSFGEELVFENIDLDSLMVHFVPEDFAVPPGSQVPFSVSDDALASDTILDDVDTVEVFSGTLLMTTWNRLPIPVTYTTTLIGFTQMDGTPLQGVGTVPAAPGDGSYASDVQNFDLTNVTVVPASVIVSLEGSGTVGGTPVPGWLGDSAIVQSGSIATMQVEMVAGTLDPATTPELTVTVEEVEEVSEDDFDLGDLEDVIDSSTINSATISLVVENGAAVQAVLSDFFLGLVILDPSGNVPRDAFGNPVFEEDSGGSPILVPVVDPGDTILTVAASGVDSVDLEAAALVDPLVHILLDDEHAAIVAVGDVAIGDGSAARVTRSDEVIVKVTPLIGLDLTIPATGVTLTRNTTQTGLELDSADADQLVEHLDSARVITVAENNTPFGVVLDIAFIEGSLGEDVDIFGYPGRVVLDSISLNAPTVDAQGLVTAPTTDTVTIALTGDQARQLTGDEISATIRARLIPGAGGAARGAIRASDEIVVRSQARIVLRSGGGGQ